jgi:hypothetical protein
MALQSLDARADRGLRDMQTVGGSDKIAGGGYGKEGAGEFDVHIYIVFIDIK